MSRELFDRWRLLAASFRDSDAGARASERLGAAAAPALEVLVAACADDLGVGPRDLDGERVRELLSRFVPARLGGGESYVVEMPDLVEEFLLHAVSEEPGVSPFEIVSAVTAARGDFEAAMADAGRERRGTAETRTPYKRPGAKLGRNDPCFCGSGRKYKACCAKLMDP